MDGALSKFYRSTFVYGLIGSILLWIALPPLGLWPLAWIAPVWWVMLVRQKELSGKRPYASLWLAGFLFWLAECYWLTFPHPATSIGWVALSFYFGFYLPVFVGLSRVAVHQLRVPVIIAAPVVWAGLELARAHLLTGMTMASLGHTQYRWIALIQIADLGGAIAVGALVMFAAACIARMLPVDERPRTAWPLAPAFVVLTAVLLYGHFRMASLPPVEERGEPTRIALIQGSIDSKLKADPGMRGRIFKHYRDLSQEAVNRFRRIDLIIWPETMFREPYRTYDEDVALPEIWEEEGRTREQFMRAVREVALHSETQLGSLARGFETPMLIGVDREHIRTGGSDFYNDAVYVNADGKVVGNYDKMHRVIFGEYIPFGELLGDFQRQLPLPVNLTAGDQPKAFEVNGVRIAPSICFETVLSRVIRRQVNTLRREGREPDILANLTNDGWFRGSNELDLHMICGVFRAVECRKPLVIAANTGFSAWIDGDGRVLRQGRRRDTDLLLAEVRPDPRRSLYVAIGDWPAAVCLAACIVFAIVGIRNRRKAPAESQTDGAKQ